MWLISAFRTYSEQRIRVQAVLAWAERHLKEGELVTVSVAGFARWYMMSKGQIRTDSSHEERTLSFIVCEPRGLHTIVTESQEDWGALFCSSQIEVWENRRRHSGVMPARLGLSKKDSTTLLAIARRVLEQKVIHRVSPTTEDFSKEIEQLPSDTVSADVAVWVNGELRASMIVTDRPLVEAVTSAAERAAHDSRFQPLAGDDLAQARLELTLWSDLEIPLLPQEIAHGEVQYTKAYIARKERRVGWYLPTVFNCIRFKSLESLLESLARTKGRFSPQDSQFFLAETQGWIESHDTATVMPLHGPIVDKKSKEGIVESATRGADWLVSLQEPSGYIRGIIDPFESYPSPSVQWVRLAFTAYTLAIFGLKFKHPAKGAAKLLFEYILRSVPKNGLSSASRVLLEAYLGQAARALALEEEMYRSASIVAEEAGAQEYDPILYLQSSAFLYAVGDEYRVKSEELYRVAARAFLATSVAEASLASYAELVTLAPLFGDIVTATRVEEWYKELQHRDGSFPDTPKSSFAYTRGTGKIFEVMATDPERYREQLQKCASWMMDMQYDTENMYFVPDANKRSLLIGGFRHDAGNQQAWIDSAAHFILGVARL